MTTTKAPQSSAPERVKPKPPVGRPFEKGKSGNPGGKVKAVVEVVTLARANTEAAMRTLVDIMQSKGAPPAARVAAANSVLDRAWGRPAQALEVTGANGGPLQVQQARLDGLSDADLITLEALLVRASIARGDSGGEGAPPAA